MPEKQEANTRQPHPDFPNVPILGASAGTQRKLLLIRVESGTYTVPIWSPEEIFHRFTIANDLADQLPTYFKRKKREYPEWTDEKNYERIRLALIKKANEGKWSCTSSEQTWIMDRLRERSAL